MTTSYNNILELITYDKGNFDWYSSRTASELLQYLNPERVNWINIDALTDSKIIEDVQAHFNLHSLLIDDVINEQRPKTEEFEDYLFVSLKMLHRIRGHEADYEQISFVLGGNYLISFQEKEGDPFDVLRERIRLDKGRVRKRRADYLLYRLIDIIVDNYYVILDNVGDMIEDIEDSMYENPTNKAFRRIQQLKKDLIYLRKAVQPLRDALNKLIKDESGFIEEDTRRFFSDIYDHVVHLLDSLDTYNDLTGGLMDLYFNTQSNRLNEVIRVLTVISTIFIPLTFIVGIYGMNFNYMPEIEWHWGYFSVWGVMLLITCGMLYYFKFKKWF